MFLIGNFPVESGRIRRYCSRSGTSKSTHVADARKKQGTEGAAQGLATRFGALIRERREALKLRQDDIAFSTGLGRRFIIELEAGKPSCHLGKALVVAAAVGLRPIDLMAETN